MADFESRDVNTSFIGLTTTVALFAVIGTICLTGFEVMRQLRRLPKVSFVPFWKRDKRERQGGRGGVDVNGDDRGGNTIGTRDKLTCEDWEMGHLYLARMFHARMPTPAMASWPLLWAYQALNFNDWFYATHTGMDTVVYVRFLRGCVYWLLLQTCTTAPILLAVHFKFSVGVPLSDMNSASLSFLVGQCDPNVDYGGQKPNYINCKKVPNEEGRKLLWIHLCLLWYVTATWFYTLWWIGRGSLRIRKRWIEELRRERQEAKAAGKMGKSVDVASSSDRDAKTILFNAQGLNTSIQGDDSDGWRQRTLLVTNLPPTMRDEASVRRYFEEFLRPDSDTPMSSVDDLHSQGNSDGQPPSKGSLPLQNQHTSTTAKASDILDDASYNPIRNKSNGDQRSDQILRGPVQTVVLVRKMNELSAMLSRRQEVLGLLEAAHIKLAQGVLTKIGQQTKKMRKENKENGGDMGGVGMGQLANNRSRFLKAIKRKREAAKKGATVEEIERDNVLRLQEAEDRLNDLTHRLARFAPTNQGHHMREVPLQGYTNDETKLDNTINETVWEALSQIPRELIDPYQPVTRLSSLFRGQKVPTIDYLLTKLNLLTALVTEMRARSPTSYEPTSTAFVTFRDPRQARMVWRELKSQIVVKVRLAPEVKDLDWERLMRTSFTGDIVRGFGVNTFFWFATILWVIAVGSLSTSLFSVSKLEALFPSVQRFFENNPTFKGFISNTLPSLIVALLTMAVPEVIFQISKRAQGFVTFSALYDECLCRYWKFVICNVVIFFCIGSTALSSVIFQVHKDGSDENILNSVAFAFPTAAPFYISYLILGMALHTGFELLGFMVPLIQHLGARNAVTPRVRAIKTLPRNFNRYYWLPFHILIVSIVFLFALLNPLIIPFALVYMIVAMLVFKKNFAYTYFRKFNEKEGVIYFIRLLRFSLDGLLVGQIVILIFFSVTKQSAVYIALTAVLLPINVATKLSATRLWKSQCRALEDDEAIALCGISPTDSSTPTRMRDYLGKPSSFERRADEERIDYTAPIDARASGRFPPKVVVPQTSSRVLLLWSYVQDKFNANGNDRPSFVVSAQARGNQLNARTVTSAVANMPVAMGKSLSRGVPVKAHPTSRVGAMSRERESHARKKAMEMQDEVSTTKDDIVDENAIRRGKTSKNYTTGKLSWSASTRSNLSEEAPFLSGYDVIAHHAPVASQDDNSEYYDGELDRSTSMGTIRSRSRHNRKSTSCDTTPMKSGQSDYAQESYRGAPLLEVDEADANKASGSREDIDNEQDEEEKESESMNSKEEDSIKGGVLVRPHGKVQWDDSPNNAARYNNPFYSVELDPYLWLPRDPMKPIDLCDTIEWHGAALVSSQGGAGRVGEWEDDQEQGETTRAGNDENGSMKSLGEKSTILCGNEHIEILGPLAQRLQEAEDADEAMDPTKSIPRNQMDDYKKALDEVDSSDSTTKPRRSNSLTAGLMRASSMMSSQSRRHSNDFSSGMNTSGEGHAKQHKQLHAQQHHHHEDALEEGDEIQEPIAGGWKPKPSMTELPASQSGFSISEKISLRRRGNEGMAGAAPTHDVGSMIDHEADVASMNTAMSPTKRTVSMRRALKAEVLEEEYRRTIRARLIARKKKAKEDAAAEEAIAKQRVEHDGSKQQQQQRKHGLSSDDDEAVEMQDLEAQNTNQSAIMEQSQSKIMNRHERMMHPTVNAEYDSGRVRREGSRSVASVKAIVTSPFKTPRRSDRS